MAYSSGMLDKRIEIYNRMPGYMGEFGHESGEYIKTCEVWASVTWAKGSKAMNEGTLDAYDTVMIRLRWRKDVGRYTRIKWNGRIYEVETLHANRGEDTIQLTARELVGESEEDYMIELDYATDEDVFNVDLGVSVFAEEKDVKSVILK